MMIIGILKMVKYIVKIAMTKEDNPPNKKEIK